MARVRVLIVQVALGGLLLEACLRLYNPLPFRIKGETIVLPVRQVYRFDNHGAQKLDPVTTHTKNSLGFRGPDPPRDFDRRLTVLTIGGSTTESLFLSDGKTWTDRLSRRLSAVVQDAWVNNAGLDGQSTYGHLVLLESAVIKLRPKAALFLVGTNDVALDRANTYDSALTSIGSRAARLRAAIVDHSAVAGVVQNLYRVVSARQRGFGHAEVDPKAARHLVLDEAVIRHTLDAQPPFLDQYRQRLVRIAQLCRANQIDPVFITQPALFGDTVDPATGVNLSTVQVNGRGNGTLEWKLLERYNDVTRDVGRDHGVLVVDLARELPKDSRFFYDFLHFTNEGSVVVGDIVFRRVCRHLMMRFGQSASCDAA
jgi:lysophospholipase L1-like esterase